MNSKLYNCKQCNTLVKIRSKGLCSKCRRGQLPAKQYNYIYSLSKKLKNKKRIKIDLMSSYWKYHLESISNNCENCGRNLTRTISNIAHILPKRKTAHPEVCNEINNYMYLCSWAEGGNCHETFDSKQGSQFIYDMPVFIIAYGRYKQFRDKVRVTKYSEIFENYEI